MVLTEPRAEDRNVASTPLLALDSVVLDTETTGLDARTARLVQLGAIRLGPGGDLAEAARFEQLVDPGVPIPAMATSIHGITNENVRNAPSFSAIAPDLEAFLGSSVLIGHTIAYDLAILQREYELSGRRWRRPRTLDVRDLAELAQPTLARYDLDRLCEWLAIDISGRHTAIGDALATARLFMALVPLLRQRGIRTLAEAEAASREMSARRSQVAPHLAGEAEPAVGDSRRPIARVDSFVYRHRVRDVMSAPAITAPADATVRDTLRLIIERKISSVFVTGRDIEPGIVTERDLLRAIDDRGPAGLDAPIGSIAKRPLQSVQEDDFLYRAIGRMERLGFRHLAVRNAEGKLTGAVTTRNLLRHRATTAIVLGDQIDSAARRRRAGASLVAAADARRQPAGRRGRSAHGLERHQRRDLRPDAACRGACRGAPGAGRQGTAAGRLCRARARLGRPRRIPARGRSGQRHRLRDRRAR